MKRRLALAILIAIPFAISIGAASASAAGISRSSTFDSNAENWIVLGGSAGFTTATYHSTGGNLGGYISADDSGRNSDASTFQSSFSDWSGNASHNYGGTISFDFRNSVVSDVGPGLIIFTSNFHDPLCAGTTTVPTALTWQSFPFTVDPATFSVCDIGPITGPQMTAALAGFLGIQIAASTANGAETMAVDNAIFSGGSSGPTGSVGRSLKAKFVPKAHKFKGTLDAEDDFSCAHDQKVAVFRKAKGPDKKVGTATTAPQSKREATGTAKFALKDRAKAGTYYAKAASASATLDGNTCKNAKSPPVKVK